LFLEPIRWVKVLGRRDLRALSRADFQRGADADAERRIAIAIAAFGPVPPAIFAGKKKPPHSRRPPTLSALPAAQGRHQAPAAESPFPTLDPDLI
jgi:hypothetical protein